MRLTIRSATIILLVLLLALTALPLAGCTGDDESTTPATETGDPEDARDAADTEATSGDALIDAKCTRCHSRIQVDNAQKTREEWEATVERMVRNGADLTEAEQAEIVDYLSAE